MTPPAVRLFAVLALLAASVAGAAAAADGGSFLFDALRERPYRAAWDRLMKEVQPTPDWLMQFNRNFDGVSGALKAVDVGGKAFHLAFVCKPQDCGDRKFEVMFDADASHAYGALGGRNDPPAFFGAPPPDVQDALAKGFQS